MAANCRDDVRSRCERLPDRGNNIGFYGGSGEQVINQNAAATQEINTWFSFGPDQNSRINLNAGDLVISAANVSIDSAASVRNLTVTGGDSTRRTVTFSGNVNKGGNNADPDVYIQANKRALVTGSLTLGSGNDGCVFIDDGVPQFSGAGSMAGGRPVIGSTSGSGNAAMWLDTPDATFARQLEVRNGTSTVSAQYEDTITLSGGLAGSGNVLFTQSGVTGSYNARTFVLSGNGGNTGTVRVDGTANGSPTKLRLANVNALQGATLDLATADVGTVEFTVAGTNTYALGGLQGSRNLALGANSLTIGGNNQSTTYSGGLSGTGSVTKAGSGTLRLTGTNNTTAGTTVSAGTLQVDGSLAAPLSVAAAGTLSGTGSVRATRLSRAPIPPATPPASRPSAAT